MLEYQIDNFDNAIYSSPFHSAIIDMHFADLEYKRVRKSQIDKYTRDYMQRLYALHNAVAAFGTPTTAKRVITPKASRAVA